jgi:hypothetical protein
MNKIISVLILVGMIFIFGCRDSKTDKKENTEDQLPVRTISLNPDSLFNSIIPLQRTLMQQTSDTQSIRILLKQSFDSTAGTFYAVGIGLSRDSLSLAASKQSRRRAAEIVGQQWALYLKSWHQGTLLPYGTPIQGVISYNTITAERIRGDTLYLLMQIPLGSIEIR